MNQLLWGLKQTLSCLKIFDRRSRNQAPTCHLSRSLIQNITSSDFPCAVISVNRWRQLWSAWRYAVPHNLPRALRKICTMRTGELERARRVQFTDLRSWGLAPWMGLTLWQPHLARLSRECLYIHSTGNCSASENMYILISFKWDFGLNWPECKIITNHKRIFFLISQTLRGLGLLFRLYTTGGG